MELASRNYLIGYGISGLLLSVVICLVAFAVTFHKPFIRRFVRPFNCIVFLLLGVFPIITSNLLDTQILNHTAVVEFYLLLLAYGQFVHMRFVDSILFGWFLYIYFVIAVGVVKNVMPPSEAPSLDTILSLVLYSALGVLLFNFLAYLRERNLRGTFEVYFTKKQQTEQLLIEIDDLKKKTLEPQDNAPPDAPLTKAVKLLKKLEAQGDKTVSGGVSKQLREVVDILQSTRLYSPNMRTAVGDDEIGAWLDHMLGENPTDTIRPDSHVRRPPYSPPLLLFFFDLLSAFLTLCTTISLKNLELQKAERKGSVASQVNPFLESAHKLLALPMEVKVTLDEVLQLKDSWDFDVFRVSEITNGHPLLFLAHRIFVDENYLFEFKISEDTFLSQ